MWKHFLPRSWRETVIHDLEDEARRRQRGSLWVIGQTLLVAVRLRPIINGGALASDLRYAARALWRSKPFAIGAILTFAIGIGVNVAVFTMVDRMLIRPVPYSDSDRLFVMGSYGPGESQPYGTVRATEVVDIRQRHGGIEDLAVIGQASSYRLAPDQAEALQIPEASFNALDVLGVRPMVGRAFTEADARAMRRGVILTFDAWQARFGGRADVLEQRLWREGEAVEIIGVLPEGFFVPPSYWVGRADGIGLDPDALIGPYPPDALETLPYVRLKAGVEMQAVEAELQALWPDQGGATLRLAPIRLAMFGRLATYTYVVILAAGLVLLMCCANLASLMLVRARSRAHHTALHLALGASRYRVVRAAVLESLCLAGMGTVVALITVVWSQSALRAFVPEIFRRYAVDSTDGRVLAFSVGATLLCALIAGVLPAWRTLTVSVGQGLQAGGWRNATGIRRGGAWVLAAEALIAVLLVSGAAVTGRSLAGAMVEDLGFDREGLHFVGVHYAPYAPDAAVRLRQFTEALEVLRATPGLERVAAADVLPIIGAVGNRFLPGDRESTAWRVTDDFFSTMGVPVLAGREFTAADIISKEAVSILSVRGLRKVWPDATPADAIGRVLQVEGHPATRVVGVVGDVRGSALEQPKASLYLPIPGEQFRILRFVARGQPGAAVPVDEVQRRLAVMGNTGVVTSSPVGQRAANMLADHRFRAALFGSFAAVGLVLACVGLYAVTAFEVRLRRSECGVRLALGATPGRVVRGLLQSALVPLGVGTGVGLAVAWWAGPVLQPFVHQVSARDPWTLLLVGGALVMTGLLAAWLPAREASRIDPAVVLRTE